MRCKLFLVIHFIEISENQYLKHNMDSISLKEAAARRGVSERRITQLANEAGSGVWRLER